MKKLFFSLLTAAALFTSFALSGCESKVDNTNSEEVHKGHDHDHNGHDH